MFENRLLDKRITFRVKQKEYEELERKAKENKKSISEYIRHTLLNI